LLAVLFCAGFLTACPGGSPESSAPNLTGISITSPPGKTAYTAGDAFTADGLVVTAAYSDGSTKIVTAVLAWNGAVLENGSTAITAAAGTKTVTVTYDDGKASFSLTFTITINATLNPPPDPPPPDTTPPANVSGQNSVDGQGQVVLSWTDPPDADLASIEITWTPGGATPVRIPKGIGQYTAVVDDGAYTFTIKAVDASGNKSAGITLAANPNASAPADTTPPAEAGGLNAVGGIGQVSLTWADPADGDFASVEITWTPGGTTPRTIAKGTGTYTAAGLADETEYTFTIRTKDAAGNLSAGRTIAGTTLSQILQPTAQVTATFTGPQDETITLSGVQNLSKADNTQLTVSVSGSFTAYRWFLDGVLRTGETGNSLTLYAGVLDVKQYELTVFVTRDGVEYAKSVKFTVNN
jgi:hypothetical protein